MQDSFFLRYQKLIKDVVIPYQWDVLNDNAPGAEPSHAIENFRIAAGQAKGEFYGMVFQDSDVAKWLEAVAYSLSAQPDTKLERIADEVIALVGSAQQQDGYLNTYFTVKEPDKKWTDLAECHELYCAGHFIEAGVAYFWRPESAICWISSAAWLIILTPYLGGKKEKLPGIRGIPK